MKRTMFLTVSMLLVPVMVCAKDAAQTKAQPKVEVQAPKVAQKEVAPSAVAQNVKVADAGKVKTGYVNSVELMQQTQLGKNVAKKIEDVRKTETKKVQDKELALKKKMEEFKGKESTLSKEAREKLEGEIVALRRDYEGTLQAAEDKLKLAMQRATEELSQEIEKTVGTYAQKNGYDVVNDIYSGRTIFASNKVMVTSDIIKGMDASYAAKNTKSAA